MANQYLHGIEFVSINYGARTVETPRAGIIGIVGTAPEADEDILPINTPVVLRSAAKADVTAIGDNGTLAKAFDYWYRAQANLSVVVVRVDDSGDVAAQKTAIINGLALLSGAESVTGLKPRINIAPYYANVDVGNQLVAVCDKIKGIAFIDAPDTATDTAATAITFAKNFGSKRANVCWPSAMVWDVAESAVEPLPMSIVAAALEAGTDYWKSSSNNIVPLVSGTSKPVSFEVSSMDTTANLLNENGINTVVHQSGYRLWGARNCSADPLWKYRQHVRLDDMIADAIVLSHLWAVDRNITLGYVDEVVEGVGAYLRYLASPGIEAVAGGKCWADPDVNNAATMEAGQVFFDFDYGRFGMAERVTFRRFLNQSYVEEII